MARVSPIQGDFSAGEFSPLLQGRTDVARYKAGLFDLTNMIATLQGPTTRRGGSVFVANAATNSRNVKLIPFKFSNSQAYMLEFSEHKIRFYTNHGQILDPNTGLPLEVATDYSDAEIPGLRYTQSLDTLYIFHVDKPPKLLQRSSNTSWSLTAFFVGQNGPNDGPYFDLNVMPHTSCPATFFPFIVPSANTGNVTMQGQFGGGPLPTITGAVSSGIPNLIRVTINQPDFYKTGDRVWVAGVNPAYMNGDWTVTKISTFVYDFQGSVFGLPFVAGGFIDPAFFVPSDVGTPMRIESTNPNPNAGWAIITNFVNGLTVKATVQFATGYNFQLIPIANITGFRLSFWSPTFGYPSCGTFHEDRLYLSGSNGALQRIDASAVGDYKTYAPTLFDKTVTASTAIVAKLNSNDANQIVDIKSDEYGLPILTKGGPWIAKPSSLNEALTATNFNVKRISTVGAANQIAAYAGKATIYLEASTRKIKEFVYFYTEDGFKSIDLTEIAEHMPGNGITTELVFQSSPQPIIWMARADGQFMGVTYSRDLQQLRTGWHKHYLGGKSDVAGTPPIVESLGVIPSPDATTDDVWIVVRRWINGQQVKYVEYLNKIFEEFDLQEDAHFLDCSVSYDIGAAGYVGTTLLSVTGSIANTNPVSVNSIAHGLVTGDFVRFRKVAGFRDSNGNDKINGIKFKITVINADNFQLDLFDATALTPYAAGTGEWRKMIHTISGLTWLEGETVSILGDGAVFPDVVVDGGGAITFAPSDSQGAGLVQIGYKYSSRMKQLRLEAGAADGTAIGKNRRANEVAIMVHRSGDFNQGTSFDSTHLEEVVMRNAQDPIDRAPPLFSGIKDSIQVDSDYDLDNGIAIEVSDPTPLTVLAIMPQLTTYDKG